MTSRRVLACAVFLALPEIGVIWPAAAPWVPSWGWELGVISGWLARAEWQRYRAGR